MIIPSITHLRAVVVPAVDASDISLSNSDSCNDLHRCRTLFQIVWSCVSVVIACTWVSIHPNVPGPNESSWKVIGRRIRVMIITIMAPELLVFGAARQWFAARKLSDRYNNEKWSRAHAFLALMGGFGLYEGKRCVCVLRFLPRGCSESAKEDILKDFNTPKHAAGTLDNPVSDHSNDTFVQSNRSCIVSTGSPLESGSLKLEDDSSAVASIPYQAINLQDNPTNGTTKFDDRSFAAHASCIGGWSEREVKNCGHNDGLGKLVAVGQTSWFVLQLVARWAEGLLVTELEVMTLAFAAMNVLVYFFWWDKPLGVRSHIRIQRKTTNQHTNAQPNDHISEDGSWISSVMNWLRHTRRDVQMATCKFSEDCKEKGVLIITLRRIILPPLQGLMGLVLADEKDLESHLEKMIEGAGAPLKTALAMVCIISAPLVIFAFLVLPGNDTEEEQVSPLERNVDLEPPNAEDKLIMYGAGVVYGAIHCAAWTYKFPSTVEALVWRTCSLLVTFIPIYLAFFITILGQIVRMRKDKLETWWIRCLALVSMVVFLSYLLARFLLITQAFLALRDLPPDVFQNVRWTAFIPHI
ncbi:hypothetical protein GYMLUDRAFT_232550 [Collybiopsis luxurians FD-317 M1]|uniref:Uncharacterized protein n=1 Tax=Collybiopsis luxurians FD-317 M1 TaxID=944289 RepID=A0A0D0BGX7_9AGAR|nr:hypothetical protein GYMLUDRAFT_232550 [Collybiopsis luxurians FD-317 M1]